MSFSRPARAARPDEPRPVVTEVPDPRDDRRITWLTADTIWWGGRLRTGVVLRVGVDGLVKPIPAELAPAGDLLRFPGTLLPGLVDAHVHSALADLATIRAGLALSAATHSEAVARPHSPARAPHLRLPRIRYAGPFLTAPGGYPSDRSWAPAGSWREITSPADAGAAVAEAGSTGATLIKVTAHTGGPTLPQPTLRALVDAAHTSGLPVVVHAEGAGTVAAAFDAGADLLAHTPWTEPLPDTLIRACATRMTWISTFDIHGWGDPDPAQDIALDNLRRFIEHGGKVRYGTDLGNGPLPPGVNPRELRALRAAGLTPDEILLSMTEPGTPDLTWVPGGLDLSPPAFADSLATARVLDETTHPRPI
jgi:hypothetical protein